MIQKVAAGLREGLALHVALNQRDAQAVDILERRVTTHQRGDVPAFGCELFARETLLDTWEAFRTVDNVSDEYLDVLSNVRDIGFLEKAGQASFRVE